LKNGIDQRDREISNQKLQETQEFVKTVLGFYLSQLGLHDKTAFDAFLEDEDDSVWNAELFIPSFILKNMPSSPKERSTFIFNILGDSL